MALGLAVALLAACAASRPEPPPYPQVAQPSQFTALWQVSGLGPGLMGFAPALVGDTVWAAAESGRITVLSQDRGRIERQFEVGARLAAGIGSDGDLQVVVTRPGDVVAFDASGRQRWRATLGAEVTSPPTVSGRGVAIRAVDGRILFLEREDGALRWSWRQDPLPALTLRQSAAPVIDDDLLYVGLPGARVVAIDLRLGVPRWEQVVASSRGATELERLIDIAGPVVVDEQRLCAIAYQGRLACLRKDDGRVQWTRDVASGYGLALDGETIATIDGSDRIVAVKIGGDELWRQDAYVRRAMSRPVFVGDRLVFGDHSGSVHVLSAADGTPLARLGTDGKAITAAAVVSRRVAYVQSLGGSLLALPLR